MERIVLFLALAAFLTGSIVMLNMEQNSAGADGALTEYQSKAFARQAAHAGLRTTVRQLARASDAPWTAPTSFNLSNTSYEVGSYEVTLQSVGPTGDTVDVFATGIYDEDTVYVDARYKRAFDLEGTPPAFRSVILTDQLLQISGNIHISTLDPTLNANVHTNGSLSTNGNAFLVEGYGSYSGSGHTNQPDNFQPKVDYNGAESNVLEIPAIDIPDASLDSSHADVSYIEPAQNLVNVSNQNHNPIQIDVRTKADNLCATGEIPPSKCTDADGDGLIDLGRSKAFVWWVSGTIDLQNVEIAGNAVLYADANRMANGGTPTSGDGIEVDRRVVGTLSDEDETQLMLRTPGSIDVYGNDEIVATMWTNDQATFHGTPDMIGGILSPEAHFSGHGNFNLTYAAPSSVITDPGDTNLYPVGPVLIAYAEWDEETV